MKLIIFALILFAGLFIKPVRRTYLAFLALILFSFSGVGVNLINASLIGFLGIPGIAAVCALNLIY